MFVILSSQDYIDHQLHNLQLLAEFEYFHLFVTMAPI